MPKERKPEASTGYFWDVQRARASMAFRRMSFAERGVYREMLDEQWDARNLPDDPEAVADLIAITPEQRAEVIAAWDVVRRKFLLSSGNKKRIYNVQLERVRKKQKENRRAWQEAGREGGKKSAAKRAAAKALRASQGSATLEPPSTQAQAISTDMTRQEETRPDVTGQDARSKRPIYTGQRLTVFEWQLTNCMKTLGDHADNFDLHAWFDDLDRMAVLHGLVIPKRDGGAWLEAQLVAEAQRRGLPLRMATAFAGKQTTRLAAAIANIARAGS